MRMMDDNRIGVIVTGASIVTQTGDEKNEGDEWFRNVSGQMTSLLFWKRAVSARITQNRSCFDEG
jgi:hypothetical protein